MTKPASSPVILVTGGTGFAGSHLVEQLLKTHPPELIHVTTYSSRPSFIDQLLPESNIHQLDLRDAAATAHLIEDIQPTHLYHLAALAAVGSSFGKTIQVMNQNTEIQFSVLEALRLHAPQTRTLVVGSAQEYDVFAHMNDQGEAILNESAQLGPANPYGVSKVAQDLLALSYFYTYHLPIIRVRPFNHIGERQELGFAIADFAQQMVHVERGQLDHIAVGNLEAVRDFTDVKDVVQGYELVMEKGTLGEVYNVGSGQGRTMQSMLDALLALANTTIEVKVDQHRLRPLDVKSIIADSSKLQALGWQPQIAISDTLTRVVSYWRNQS
jgi:GDP-4-dehydro-6-deoxy-D-mannose reductase